MLAKNIQRKVIHIAVINQRPGIHVRMRDTHFALRSPRSQPFVNASPHVGMLLRQRRFRPTFFRRRRQSIGLFCRWMGGFLLRELGPTRVADVAVEELHLFFDSVHLVGELVEDVLLHEFQGLELLAGEGAQPLVLRQFLKEERNGRILRKQGARNLHF